MATACILMVIGVILVWNSGSCDAKPRYEYSSEQIFDDTENDLKGIPTKNSQGSSKWNNSRILGFKRVVPIKPEDCSEVPDCQLPTTTSSTSSTSSTSTHKPVFGRDRILDQLHDHTGDKQPIYHSALDGWSFG